MRTIYFSLLSLFLFSCTTSIRYVGQTRPATKKVDVFISEQTIPQPFEYIGKGYVASLGSQNPEKIQQKAVEKARVVGADAIIIGDYVLSNAITTVTSQQRSDTIGKKIVSTGSSIITPDATTGFHILFIKYTK